VKLLTEIRDEQLSGHKRLSTYVFPRGGSFAHVGRNDLPIDGADFNVGYKHTGI
jgi:hypothetical protein